VIFFTPRSGSSRLTDLLGGAGDLGCPSECFNPRMIRKMAGFFGARNLPEYVDLLQRKRATTGTFGCEITVEHLYAIFFSAQRFFDLYRPTSTVLLIRENIVEQAVSLSRMNQTGMFHQLAPVSDADVPPEFHYRPAQIRGYLSRIVRMEQQAERIFDASGLQPLRLSYEMLVATDPADFVYRIGKHVGATPTRVQELTSAHTKIGDARSLEFARRFCADNKDLLARIENARRKSLDLLGLQKDAM
jgi:LPS sulfotransferase NodH